jgi:hypothetical protein
LTLESTPGCIIADMSDCCCAATTARASEVQCPTCATKGFAVDLQTVKALLDSQAMQRLQATHHRFCASTTCDVVYFDDAGHTFSQSDLRVPVWQKQAAGARTVCYCFGETEATIRQELEQTGVSTATARVREHIAANRCACDIRNPKGSCCLGDLMAAVKRVEVALLTETE